MTEFDATLTEREAPAVALGSPSAINSVSGDTGHSPTDRPGTACMDGHRCRCIRSATGRSLSLNRSTRRLQRASVADTT
jgi:hypothetical protein